MILCLLRKPETSHLPETGFVYNGIEASDALVCRYHVSELRGAERCATSLWDRWLSVLGWNPGSMVQHRQLTTEDHGSVRFSAELRHNNKTLKERPCCSSSLTACVMTQFISFQANAKHMLPVTGSQADKPVWLPHVGRDDDRITVLYLLCSIPALKLFVDTVASPFAVIVYTDATMCTRWDITWWAVVTEKYLTVKCWFLFYTKSLP